MRCKNFFVSLFFVFIYMIFPLIISVSGKILKRIYGCNYERCERSYLCFTKISCGSNHRLADYLEQVIDTALFSLITVPIGLLVIILLILIQVIIIWIKVIRKRRSNR